MGVLAMESAEVDAYDEADERLLTTVASSMGVALENARLFGETKRLLAETDARAKELAVVNEVQRGLAEQLEMQAMYDLVGDKLSDIFGVSSNDIFGAQVVDIAILDPDRERFEIVYVVERGVRLPNITIPNFGVRRHLVETGQPLLITHDLAAVTGSLGQDAPVQGESPRAAVFAPLVVAGEVRGAVSLQSLDREYAFDDADLRLLTTITSSLSGALENARLFGETKRLLSESDARAAELAIINEIGQALASQARLRRHHELVGERIRALFETKSIYIADPRPETPDVHFPVCHERRRSDEDTGPMPPRRGPDVAGHRAEGTCPVPGPRRTASAQRRERRARLGVVARCADHGRRRGDRRAGARVDGAGRLQRAGHRPPLDGRVQHGRRAGERAPVRRNQATPHRDGSSGPPSWR